MKDIEKYSEDYKNGFNEALRLVRLEIGANILETEKVIENLKKLPNKKEQAVQEAMRKEELFKEAYQQLFDNLFICKVTQ